MNDCSLCDVARRDSGNELVVLRTDLVFVVPALKQRPLSRGHMLVSPISHVEGLFGADPLLIRELYGVAGQVCMGVRQIFGAMGATLFQNEHAPGQDLLHLHVHIVPRHQGDAFRMPDPLAEEVPYEERLRQAAELRKFLTQTKQSAQGKSKV